MQEPLLSLPLSPPHCFPLSLFPPVSLLPPLSLPHVTLCSWWDVNAQEPSLCLSISPPPPHPLPYLPFILLPSWSLSLSPALPLPPFPFFSLPPFPLSPSPPPSTPLSTFYSPSLLIPPSFSCSPSSSLSLFSSTPSALSPPLSSLSLPLNVSFLISFSPPLSHCLSLSPLFIPNHPHHITYTLTNSVVPLILHSTVQQLHDMYYKHLLSAYYH